MKDDGYFMEKALEQAQQALDRGEFPVGCVIVHRENVVASGRRTGSRDTANEIDHAEILALRNFMTKYQHIDPGEVTVYATMEPCLMCYATLLVNGVRRIVYGYEDAMGGGTNLVLAQLSPLYRDLEVDIVAGVRRAECLALYKRFFLDDSCEYLQDTLLARYTLEQK